MPTAQIIAHPCSPRRAFLTIRLYALLLLVSVAPAVAQTRDDHSFINYTIAPAADLKDGPGHATLQAVELQASAPPVALGARLRWINSLYGKSIIYRFQGAEATGIDRTERLSDLRYTALLTYQLANPKWAVFVIPALLLRTDFGAALSHHDLFPQGQAFVAFAPHGDQRLVFSVGALLTNDFAHNQLVPLTGVSIRMPRLTAEIGFPRTTLLFKPSDRLEWGLTAAADGGIFRSRHLTPDAARPAAYVRPVTIFVGQALNYHLGGALWLNTQVGYAVRRTYDLLDSDYKTIAGVKAGTAGSLLVKAGVSARFGQ